MIAVDVGGTFTDVIEIRDGKIVPAKVATDLVNSNRSVLAGAAQVGIESADVFNIASTAGLNAVITRRLPKIGLLVTQGSRDLLDAGTLARPVAYLTDPTWHRAFSDVENPLVPRYLRREVPELLDHLGEVYRRMDEDEVRRQLRVFRRCHVEGVAVSLDRAWRNPVHERRIRELVRDELGSVECCISSEVSPLARPYSRVVTTVINTCMRLLYGAYTHRLDAGLRDLGFRGAVNYADCRAMLVPAQQAMERPYRLVAGGPAAGTVASAYFGQVIGDLNVICADVGGTSCDISVVHGGKPWVKNTLELEFDLEVNALSVDIITLGAGGGSIVSISPTGDVRVGPDSVGADPGPACYGRGGTRASTTDTALLIGILSSDSFLGGRMHLDPALSLQAFASLKTSMSLDQLVSYAWRIGLNNVAEGIFNVGLRHGIDTRDFTLFAYGAAGPMVLPSMLDLVGLRRVVVPPHPGLFSALGLLSSDQVFSEERGAATTLDVAGLALMEPAFAAMEAGLASRLPAMPAGVRFERSFDGRLVGQGFETPFVRVPAPLHASDLSSLVIAFHDAYQLRNANRFEHLPIEVVTLRTNAVVSVPKVEYPSVPMRLNAGRPEGRRIDLRYLYGEPRSAVEYRRDELAFGDRMPGPAIIREDTSTTFVPADHQADVGQFGELVIA